MKLLFFYLKNCPHCIRAGQYMNELKTEHPEFNNIDIEYIEEREQSSLADTYDYFYVPCFFVGDNKLAEGVLSKEDVKKVFNEVIK